MQTSVLAMRGIISLLVQSTTTPKPGNPGNSTCDHRPRDKSLIFLHTKYARRFLFFLLFKSVSCAVVLGLTLPVDLGV